MHFSDVIRFIRLGCQKDDYNRCIYHKRELDATERTIVVMHDAERLIEICDKTGDLDDTSEYQLLIRLLKERTIIDDDGTRRLRKKEEVENPNVSFDTLTFIIKKFAFLILTFDKFKRP